MLRAIIRVDPDGKYKVLADKDDGKRFNSPSDVILGPDGVLYFTDPTETPSAHMVELVRAHIEKQGYRIVAGNPTDAERMRYPKLVRRSAGEAEEAFRTEPESPPPWK